MQTLAQWKQWPLWQKISSLVWLSLLLLGLGTYLYYYQGGYDAALPCEVFTTTSAGELLMDSFTRGIFNIEVSTSYLLLRQRYVPMPWELPVGILYLYGAVVWLAMLWLLAVATRQSLWWYGGTVTVLVAALAFSKLNYTEAMPYENGVLIVFLVALLPLSFYFYAYDRHLPIWARWLLFCLILGVLAAWIHRSSPLAQPLLVPIQHGWLIPFGLSMAFVFYVGHEVLSFLVYLVTRRKAKNHLIPVIIISLLYLSNVFLIHFRNIGLIKIDLSFLDVVWMFGLSSLIGIWSFWARSQQRPQSSPALREGGGQMYLAWGVIAVATLAYFGAIADEGMLRVSREFTMYSQLATGTMFFFYVIVNFGPTLQEGEPIQPIIYQGDVFSYRMSRIISIVVICVFFMNNFYRSYYRTQSSYHAGIASLYQFQGEERLAKEFFNRAVSFYPIGHYPLYTRAGMAWQAQEMNHTAEILSEIGYFQASPQSYLLLADALYVMGNLSEAARALEQGLQKFPTHPMLLTNMGYIKAAQNDFEAARSYWDKALAAGGDAELIRGNMLSLNDRAPWQATALDSLSALVSTRDLVGQSNLLAQAARKGQTLRRPLVQIPTDKPLPNSAMGYLYNFGLSQLRAPVDTSFRRILRELSSTEVNLNYADDFRLLNVLQRYYQGNTTEALRTLGAMPNLGNNPYHNRLLGIWLLEQERYDLAAEYFSRALTLGDASAKRLYAIALSEAGEAEAALEQWQELAKNKAPEIREEATLMLRVWANANFNTLRNDVERLAFARYRTAPADTLVLQQLYKQANSLDYKAAIGAQLLRAYLHYQEYQAGMRWYREMVATPPKNKDGISALNRCFLDLLLATKRYDALADNAKKLPLTGRDARLRDYYLAQALTGQSPGKNPEAESHFVRALEANPYDEDVVLAAVHYYQYQKKNVENAYMAVVYAVQLQEDAVELQKTYALLCLEMNLIEFGDKALAEVKRLANEADFRIFEQKYQERKHANDTLATHFQQFN
jgi:tetratricopeptide (TPR) repeat protein